MDFAKAHKSAYFVRGSDQFPGSSNGFSSRNFEDWLIQIVSTSPTFFILNFIFPFQFQNELKISFKFFVLIIIYFLQFFSF